MNSSSKKYAFLLLFFLLALSIVPSALAKEKTNSETFNENFDQETLDPAKWAAFENTHQSGYPAYGGSIELNNGALTLSSSGSSFPFIYSTDDPFPTSGDFEIELSMQYTCIADLGCGVMISNGAPLLDANWHRYKIITIWAHDKGPELTEIYIEAFSSCVYKISVLGFKPTSAEHTYRIAYIDGTYNIYVDDKFVAEMTSEIRPNMIVLGNPPNPDVPRSPDGPTGMDKWGFWGWSKFKINHITVNSQPGDESGSEPQLLPTKITLSTNAETQQIGNINMQGTLTSNEQPIPDATILLYVSTPGANKWQPLVFTTTNSGGAYSASWTPETTGKFTLKSEFAGDSKYALSFAEANITVKDTTSENGNDETKTDDKSPDNDNNSNNNNNNTNEWNGNNKGNNGKDAKDENDEIENNKNGKDDKSNDNNGEGNGNNGNINNGTDNNGDENGNNGKNGNDGNSNNGNNGNNSNGTNGNGSNDNGNNGNENGNRGNNSNNGNNKGNANDTDDKNNGNNGKENKALIIESNSTLIAAGIIMLLPLALAIATAALLMIKLRKQEHPRNYPLHSSHERSQASSA